MNTARIIKGCLAVTALLLQGGCEREQPVNGTTIAEQSYPFTEVAGSTGHEHVDRTVRIEGTAKRRLDVIGVANVGAEADGLTATDLLDLANGVVDLLLRAAQDADVRARSCEAFRNA